MNGLVGPEQRRYLWEQYGHPGNIPYGYAGEQSGATRSATPGVMNLMKGQKPTELQALRDYIMAMRTMGGPFKLSNQNPLAEDVFRLRSNMPFGY